MEAKFNLSNRQARQFILLKQGLLGEHKFTGKQGAFDYIHQAGCIQFDPVNVCGRNAEITLQARVKGFKKKHLHELLYEDRKLFDYPDKQLSIIPIEYWPYFERIRKRARQNIDNFPEISQHTEDFRTHIKEHGAVSSDDFKVEGSTKWWSAINWSANGKISRSVLEQMYSSGDLIIHHKKGIRRHYDLAERYIPDYLLNASDPLPDDFDNLKWRVLRRIGAVGLLWNSASSAWLGIEGLPTDVRHQVFDALLDEGKITMLTIEGIKSRFYIVAEDAPIIENILANPDIKPKPRCELIAPLDPFLWDRKLIKKVFDFEYSWEIYTPADKRKYAAYVLPLLCGEQFVGRVEAVCERETQTLLIKNIWYEDGIKQTKKLDAMIKSCVKRFAAFNDCKSLLFSK